MGKSILTLNFEMMQILLFGINEGTTKMLSEFQLGT